MATSNNTQILIDTTRLTVIKRVGIFDASGGNELETVLIDPKTLSGFLNANGALYQTGNTITAGYASNAFTIKKIIYNVDAEVGHLQLKWQGVDAANSKTIFALGAGAGDTNPNDNLPAIWNNSPNPSGNVTILTSGTTANAAYTLIIELIKNGQYYNAGQLQDPAAFNYGPYSITP